MTSKVRRLTAVIDHRFVRGSWRALRLLMLAASVVIAVVLVTAVTIDPGPHVRKWAEKGGEGYLKRPLHIGKISFRLYTGHFLFEDLVIEGPKPQSRPFLTAKRVEVSIPWTTLFDKRFVLRSIEMVDWKMYIEVDEGGKHSMPHLAPESRPGGKSGWTTTLEWVRAHRGEFTFEDHTAPWSVITRNLDVTVAKPGSEYRGQASFSNGLVSITSYVPFRADMTSSFRIDGSRVVLEKIDMITDGARSSVHGDVNLKYWPEQSYRVESTYDLRRMRQLFFANEKFELAGNGRFEGYFHLFKEPMPDGTNRTGRELSGTFYSAKADVSAPAGATPYNFQDLRGSVRWTPEKLAVTDASASLYGGSARFSYDMAPLGRRGVPITATFAAQYGGINVHELSDFVKLDGVRLAGTADGQIDLTWPLGRFAQRQFAGNLRVMPPAGVDLMTRQLPVELIELGRLPRGPAAPLAPMIPLALGAELSFSSTPGRLVFGPSRVMTPRSYVEIEGETTMDGRESRLPFFLASADWQESYRVFADIMTALGSPITVQDVAGYGTFDGELTGDIRRPRIEGTFDTYRMRAWDVEWGSASGRALIDNNYADVREATIRSGDSVIHADGRFSLGFPRKDGGEEINAQVRIDGRPIADLRHAFDLDDYPVDGLLSGDFHVFGEYRRPLGYGTVTVANGRAYGEPFQSANASVNLEGDGIRLTGLEVEKGAGRGTGAAFVGWDATYSFDFAGSAIPVEDVALFARAPLPLSGLIDFTASGSGPFSKPRYKVNGQIRDLFAADEGIGQVVAELDIVENMMTVQAKAASARLAVDIDGQVELSSTMFSDLTFRVRDTSLDPYVRAYFPEKLSPYTEAVVSGTVHVRGELMKLESLSVETDIERLALRFFDYRLANKAPFRVVLGRNSVEIPTMTLTGSDTELEIYTALSLESEQMLMRLSGQANLALLQGLVSNVRSSGTAVLEEANVTGSLRDPEVHGRLRIENGRIRHFGAPQGIDQLNGAITFDARGVTLDGLTGRVGEGPVRFGGRIEKVGYLPGRLDVTIRGENMRLRYPADMLSVVDADLTLQGTLDDMRLGGDVLVRNAIYSKPFPTNVLDLLPKNPIVPSAPGATVPLTYDNIRITGNSLRVQNSGENSARISATAALELSGTYARPSLGGQLEFNPGSELRLLGKRYTVTHGAVYFANPDAIEPTFEIEAETRVRVPGETYRITASINATYGSTASLADVTFDSDPSLSRGEIMALLIADVPPGESPELYRAQGDNDARQRQAVQDAIAQLAASPVSSTIDRTLRAALRVDAVRITPSLVSPDPLSSRLEPCAQIQFFQRIGARGNLQYGRSLCSTSRGEIILFEYDATDRFSWLLSRNEDQAYAIEVRVRHAF